MQKDQTIAIVVIVLLVGGFLGLVVWSNSKNKNSEEMAYDQNSQSGDNSPVEEESQVLSENTTPTPETTPNTDQMANAKMTVEEKLAVKAPTTKLEAGKDYKVVLNTSEGKIIIDLNEKETPITANNFAYLSEMGFYNDVIFHRVIEGFMIQSGDPLGSGMGGPSYKFNDEKFEGEYSKGTVAMANSGPNTNGSQFFIMHADYPLPKDYVIFGKVSEGLDVVDKIATAKVASNAFGEASTPANPVKILDVEVQKVPVTE